MAALSPATLEPPENSSQLTPSRAEVVKSSLSAWDQHSFEWVNRPHERLRFEQVLEGQKIFRTEFSGKLYLEVFAVGGMNAMASSMGKIAALAEEIAPDRIHLNTAVRPPAEDFVYPVPKDRMELFAQMFGGTAEVIADYDHVHDRSESSVTCQDVLDLLKRRPCSIDDVAQGLAIHRNKVLKHLGQLVKKDTITTGTNNGKVFYIADSLKERDST